MKTAVSIQPGAEITAEAGDDNLLLFLLEFQQHRKLDHHSASCPVRSHVSSPLHESPLQAHSPLRGIINWTK